MISSATTLSAFLCLDICLAHITMSNQLHLCWEFSSEFGGLLHAGVNISFIYREPYFFQNERGGRDVIRPKLPFSIKANKEHSGKGFWYVSFSFWITESLCSCKNQSIIYMKITFLYKRQILVLHYFDSKNIDYIIVKQQITLQNILYAYRKLLGFSIIFTYFLIACFLKTSHACKIDSIFWF